MIRLRLLADRLFASTTAVMFTGAMAFLGSLYLVAPFRQGGLGLSVLNAGLSTFPEALSGRPSSSSAPPFNFSSGITAAKRSGVAAAFSLPRRPLTTDTTADSGR